MSEQEAINIEFQIKAIEILNSSLIEPKKKLPKVVEFQFDISLEHRISLEKDTIIVICTVSIFNEIKDQMYGQLCASCIYHVVNLNEIAKKTPTKNQLPTQFLMALNSISVSTMRGLMYSSYKGTFLHNAILPIIDPKTFQMDKSVSK